MSEGTHSPLSSLSAKSTLHLVATPSISAVTPSASRPITTANFVGSSGRQDMRSIEVCVIVMQVQVIKMMITSDVPAHLGQVCGPHFPPLPAQLLDALGRRWKLPHILLAVVGWLHPSLFNPASTHSFFIHPSTHQPLRAVSAQPHSPPVVLELLLRT